MKYFMLTVVLIACTFDITHAAPTDKTAQEICVAIAMLAVDAAITPEQTTVAADIFDKNYREDMLTSDIELAISAVADWMKADSTSARDIHNMIVHCL